MNIDVSSSVDTAAFKIADNSRANVSITLADGSENTLKSGENCAGLQKNGEYFAKLGKLTIKGGTSGSDVVSLAADGTITAKKAVTAIVEITAAETTTYAKASKTVTVTVNKAAVTIKANSYTIKVGDDFPALGYTVTGLANGENLGVIPELSCETDNTSTAGSYTISVKFNTAEDEKYIYTVQNGTLTVQKKSSGSSCYTTATAYPIDRRAGTAVSVSGFSFYFNSSSY